jgi:hypothetical protein
MWDSPLLMLLAVCLWLVLLELNFARPARLIDRRLDSFYHTGLPL